MALFCRWWWHLFAGTLFHGFWYITIIVHFTFCNLYMEPIQRWQVLMFSSHQTKYTQHEITIIQAIAKSAVWWLRSCLCYCYWKLCGEWAMQKMNSPRYFKRRTTAFMTSGTSYKLIHMDIIAVFVWNLTSPTVFDGIPRLKLTSLLTRAYPDALDPWRLMDRSMHTLFQNRVQYEMNM